MNLFLFNEEPKKQKVLISLFHEKRWNHFWTYKKKKFYENQTSGLSASLDGHDYKHSAFHQKGMVCMCWSYESLSRDQIIPKIKWSLFSIGKRNELKTPCCSVSQKCDGCFPSRQPLIQLKLSWELLFPHPPEMSPINYYLFLPLKEIYWWQKINEEIF